jgi:hypothetical protein
MSRGHHPIPEAALDDRLGFVGTAGSGKTYNSGSAVERLLHHKRRVAVIDPLGVWWGLRLRADGKASGFDVVIFGGPHGDLPLNEHAGALIGETVATMAESCIVDLSALGTKSAERRFMTAFLEAIYRKSGGALLHLVVDEADMFAPQKPPKGDETLLNLMEQIVRRGRVKGFIPWLITQRPAVINKNVLSQVDGLVAFKLTSSQDRDALDAWIEGQADKAHGREIKDALPALPVGTGVIWVPGRGVLETKAFPLKVTFDSSRAPKRGEKVKRATALKPLDLGSLKERLASVEAEKKASDPKALRAEIARLATELTKAGKSKSAPASPDAIAKAEMRGFEQAKRKFAPLRAALELAMKFIIEINATNFFKAGGEAIDKSAVEKAIGEATQRVTRLVEQHLDGREKQLGALRTEAQRLAARLKLLIDKTGEDVTIQVDVRHNEPFTVSAPTARKALPLRSPIAPAGDGEQLTGPQLKLLQALAWWAAMGHATPHRRQAAAIAGWKPTGSNLKDRLSELKGRGLVDYPTTGFVTLTPDGAAAAPEPDMNANLVDGVRAVLTGPQLAVFNALLANPGPIARDVLAHMLGWQPDGSNLKDRLSELKGMEIVTYPVRGIVELADWISSGAPRSAAA